MKYAFLLAACLLGFTNSFAQFHIKEAIGSISDLKLPVSKVPIYEDDKYIVRRTCAGEFGGTVWFKNKQTGLEWRLFQKWPHLFLQSGHIFRSKVFTPFRLKVCIRLILRRFDTLMMSSGLIVHPAY